MRQVLKMSLKKYIFLIILLSGTFGYSQNSGLIVLPTTVVNGDTIPHIRLPEAEIFGYKIFKNKREEYRYDRLVKNVRIVYPYAKLAGEMLREYEQILAAIPSESEKRKIMKDLEDDLHKEYDDELKKLTITQGKILIKLIDRQTGDSSYDLVKEFRGAFRAFFYQTFARIFGLNLKMKYDPEGEDKSIETIVRMIEKGVI
ncbi:MAG: hypothetical protein BWX63_01646 [Bacteroidetes bacterium ADurb.Bin041]|jgi:hypothetical protein|nr:MAG: hypothetical protein BWX63_01646 [Bacteroidetes bacterium ADurb.Bin041]